MKERKAGSRLTCCIVTVINFKSLQFNQVAQLLLWAASTHCAMAGHKVDFGPRHQGVRTQAASQHVSAHIFTTQANDLPMEFTFFRQRVGDSEAQGRGDAAEPRSRRSRDCAINWFGTFTFHKVETISHNSQDPPLQNCFLESHHRFARDQCCWCKTLSHSW